MGEVIQAEAEVLFVEKIKGGCEMRLRAGLLNGGESRDSSLIPGKPDERPLFIEVT